MVQIFTKRHFVQQHYVFGQMCLLNGAAYLPFYFAVFLKTYTNDRVTDKLRFTEFVICIFLGTDIVGLCKYRKISFHICSTSVLMFVDINLASYLRKVCPGFIILCFLRQAFNPLLFYYCKELH